MTLIELLVAFLVLVFIVLALVSLTTASLDTWAEGEARKDIYDRAQIVFGVIAEDLRNVFTENEVWTLGETELCPPLFACDLDANRRQSLRFVRTGTTTQVRSPQPPGAPPYRVAAHEYADLWEIVYVLDQDAAKHDLWRGVRFFDRDPGKTLLKISGAGAAGTSAFQTHFRRVESGVLHVGYRFWTQYTNTWDEDAPIRRVARTSRQASGSETRWDSSRRLDRKFAFYRKRYDMKNPDFVYPEIVHVTVVLESTASAPGAIQVAERLEERATILRLNDTRGLPDPPSHVKIAGEWIEYGGKTMTELLGLKRGRRLTSAKAHDPGTPVHFGETFATEVRLPAYREAQEP